MSTEHRLTINGESVRFAPGETILEVARRSGIEIPTLCHDPRLEPAGACRTCLVEVDGWRRMPPACATKCTEGMEITSESDRITRHRQTLLSLYMTDHPTDRAACERGAPDDLHAMAEQYGATMDWGSMTHVRADRHDDANPYIQFNPETCILCARCVRYCDEVEGVSAIALAGRAAQTTISTVDAIGLLDSSCEMCGGCIDTCPTGAMAEKMPLVRGEKPEAELTKVRTTCNYCGVGCQLDLNVDSEANEGRGKVVKITSPEPGTTMNDGNTCVKGRFAYDFINHEDRLTKPLYRGEDGRFHETTWEDALQRVADGLRGVEARHGKDALGFVSSSRCTMEENYMVQKIARAAFGTNNCHQCAAT